MGLITLKSINALDERDEDFSDAQVLTSWQRMRDRPTEAWHENREQPGS